MKWERNLFRANRPHPTKKPKMPSVVTVVPAVASVNVVVAEFAPDGAKVADPWEKLHLLLLGTPLHSNAIVPAKSFIDVTVIGIATEAPCTTVDEFGVESVKSGEPVTDKSTGTD